MILFQRLISKLEYNTETYCWLWNGRIRKGYGEIKYYGKHLGTHRVAYQYFVKDIPDGLCVLHKCDVPSCCNPMHLFLGTKKDNSLDAIKKGRICRGEQVSNSKLTTKDIVDIRRSLLSTRQLGKRLNVNHTTIWKIRTNKTWKHVD